MKAASRILAVIVFSVILAPGCGTAPDGGNPIDDIVDALQPGQLQDGQQLDPLLEATAGATATAKGDFNNDGYMDLVSVSYENQPVQLHLLNSHGAFDLLSIAGGGPLAIMNDVDVADFNKDGKLDVAVLVKDTGFVPPKDVDMPSAIILLIQGANPLNASDWTWVAPLPTCYADPTGPGCDLFLSSNPTGPTDLEIGDFNNDGLPDFVVASNEPEPQGADEQTPHTFVYVYLNPGIDKATDPTEWHRIAATSNVLDFSDLAVADMDKDGDEDIVAAAPDAKTWNVQWLRNQNNGTTWTPVLIGEQFGGGNNLDVGDIDGDGSPDVAVASTAHSLIQWFRSPGPASLIPGAAQVPWYVYNIGLVSEVPVDGQTQGTEFNQVRVLDTDSDGQAEVFATGSGVAYEFQRATNVFNPWSGTALFKADPAGTLGRCAFHNFGGTAVLDIIVPVDRDGLLLDGLYLFTR